MITTSETLRLTPAERETLEAVEAVLDGRPRPMNMLERVWLKIDYLRKTMIHLKRRSSTTVMVRFTYAEAKALAEALAAMPSVREAAKWPEKDHCRVFAQMQRDIRNYGLCQLPKQRKKAVKAGKGGSQ